MKYVQASADREKTHQAHDDRVHACQGQPPLLGVASSGFSNIRFKQRLLSNGLPTTDDCLLKSLHQHDIGVVLRVQRIENVLLIR